MVLPYSTTKFPSATLSCFDEITLHQISYSIGVSRTNYVRCIWTFDNVYSTRTRKITKITGVMCGSLRSCVAQLRYSKYIPWFSINNIPTIINTVPLPYKCSCEEMHNKPKPAELARGMLALVRPGRLLYHPCFPIG